MMKRIFKKSISTEEVVVKFKTIIELNSEYKNQTSRGGSSRKIPHKFNRLQPNGSYSFEEEGKEVSYEELTNELTKIIETQLKSEANEYLGDDIIDVKIISVDKGSIVLTGFIKIVLNAVFSGIIYDFIKFTAKNLLTRYLVDRYGNFFNVDVIVFPPPPIIRNSYKERGAFFYYLLYSNFFLMGIIMGIVLGVIFYFIR